MSRLPTFSTEEVGGMRGLASLTEPGEDDSVGAIVDVAVIGARGDGKTQFIVHAIRTLRAYAPLLERAEHQYNRDVLQVVMNAREPRPDATAPGVIPHYVFRIRPDSLLSQVGLTGRLALYSRVAGLWTYLMLAMVNAAGVAGALAWLRGGLDAGIVAAAAGLALVGALAGVVLARRRVIRRGDIELVFWDVAGEHVYSGSAADYYSFLTALVRMRRRRSSPQRSYAFAPVLLCNPLALGARKEGSPYARMRRLLPLFASLNEPLARAMVAINRWSIVKEVCAPDSDRDELVAVMPTARAALDGSDPDAATLAEGTHRELLPVVQRDVVRKHCLDAEDGRDDDVHYTYLRYDAGIQCDLRARPWDDGKALDAVARTRWRAPSAATPGVVLDYVYEDGPGAFEGEVRRTFLHWVAALAYHEASYGAARSHADADTHVAAAAALPGEAAFVMERERPPAAAAPVIEQPVEAWRPKPVVASHLDELAQSTVIDERLGEAIDRSLDEAAGEVSEADAADAAGAAGEWGRETTQPGVAPARPATEPAARAATAPQPDEDAPPRHAVTLRMPGGFGSGGT